MDSSSRQLNVLLDRFLEVCNHYSSQLRKVEAQQDSLNRLTVLIRNLEQIQLTEGPPIAVIEDGKAWGQNIVPTQDTLDALAAYRDDILSRLKDPAQDLPRNIERLKTWLKQDVREIVTAFPSFTYAWDKLVELSRLTVVPDERHLQSRDIVCMATIELDQFAKKLLQLVAPLEPDTLGAVSALIVALQNNILDKVDPKFAERAERILRLLPSRGAHLDESAKSKTLQQIIAMARKDIDLLAIFGLELGFVHWLNLESGAGHRKLVIKSLIYYSKILLAEASWMRAIEFVEFAIALKQETNLKAGLRPDEGIAMFRCNHFWARHKLGEDISTDVASWETKGLHERYAFLKFVLLEKYDDAIKVLKILLSEKNPDEGANMSLEEVEEWPILEEFKDSAQYKNWRSKIQKGGIRLF